MTVYNLIHPAASNFHDQWLCRNQAYYSKSAGRDDDINSSLSSCQVKIIFFKKLIFGLILQKVKISKKLFSAILYWFIAYVWASGVRICITESEQAEVRDSIHLKAYTYL